MIAYVTILCLAVVARELLSYTRAVSKATRALQNVGRLPAPPLVPKDVEETPMPPHIGGYRAAPDRSGGIAAASGAE